jgi:hypothetical protein
VGDPTLVPLGAAALNRPYQAEEVVMISRLWTGRTEVERFDLYTSVAARSSRWGQGGTCGPRGVAVLPLSNAPGPLVAAKIESVVVPQRSRAVVPPRPLHHLVRQYQIVVSHPSTLEEPCHE